MPDEALTVRVAELYYLQQLNQEAIGQELGISRQKVSRLLKRAMESGIVHIQIRPPSGSMRPLSDELSAALKSVTVTVVESARLSAAAATRAVAAEGALQIGREIRGGSVRSIGVGRGVTLLEFSRSLARFQDKELEVVQLVGSVPDSSGMPDSAMIAAVAAEALAANARTFVAPLYVDSLEVVLALERDHRVREVRMLGSQVDAAVFGVGTVGEGSRLFTDGVIDRATADRLLEDGAVGEICGQFFDSGGEPVAPYLSRRSMAIGLSQLESRSHTTALAAGASKAEAVMGALTGGYIKNLVVDEALAQALLGRLSFTTSS